MTLPCAIDIDEFEKSRDIIQFVRKSRRLLYVCCCLCCSGDTLLCSSEGEEKE